jgi:hypothetical protein
LIPDHITLGPKFDEEEEEEDDDDDESLIDVQGMIYDVVSARS